MANTTNFGWETPDDTDLVKDGAAAIRTLGSAIDTSLVDLKGGTTGQVLSKATNTDMDFTWVAQDDSNAIQNAIVDAKGDLISATAADTPARLAVGSNDQVLTADSTTATGLKWATPASGGMTLLNTGGTTLTGSSTSITSLSTSYNDLYIFVVGFRPASDGSDLYIQLNGDSGSNRHYWAQPAFTDRTNISFDNTGIRATPATDNSGTNSLAVIHIPNYSNSTTWKFVLCYAISNNNTTATNFNWQSTQGAYNQTTAISSLNFFPGTSTMSAGTVYVYGVK